MNPLLEGTAAYQSSFRCGNPANPLNAHESPCRNIASITAASAQNPPAGASAGTRGPEWAVSPH